MARIGAADILGILSDFFIRCKIRMGPVTKLALGIVVLFSKLQVKFSQRHRRHGFGSAESLPKQWSLPVAGCEFCIGDGAANSGATNTS
jgi:hypothetical protein